MDLFSSALYWWRRERKSHDIRASLRQLFALIWEFLRESMPDRRRQRYGDVDYDWECRVDTTGATVGWCTRLHGLLHSPYQPIDPELFGAMMQSLAVEFSKFTFIDIGSGKGRALLLASEYPFKRIVGVELLPQLNQIAQRNIRKFPSQLQRCSNIDVILGNATKFSFPPDPLVIFLFHPLPETDFVEFLVNLTGSLRAFRRPVYLMYAHPLFATAVEGSGSFEKVGGTEQYSIFRSL